MAAWSGGNVLAFGADDTGSNPSERQFFFHSNSASAPCFTVSFGNTLLGLFSLSLSLFLCNFLSYTFLFLLIFNSISALVDYRNFSISIFEF